MLSQRNCECLLLESNPNTLDIMRDCLESENVRLVATRQPSEALELLRKHTYDLVILDASHSSGFALADVLKNQQQRQSRIIFSTPLHDMHNVLTQGFSIGVMDYLFKPLSFAVTRAKLQRILYTPANPKRIRHLKYALNSHKWLLDLANVAGCIVDQDSLVIEHANPRLKDISGLNEQELCDTNFFDLLSAERNVDQLRKEIGLSPTETSDADQVITHSNWQAFPNYGKLLMINAAKVATPRY